MKVKDLLKHIDTFAPFALSEDWDNTGLMTGSYDGEISRVGICLDAVSDAVTEAHKRGCEILLCHHPLIFRGLKSIDLASETGRAIRAAIEHRINVISCHTNWDKANGGVNDTLACLLGLTDSERTEEFCITGRMKESMKPEEFFLHVKSSWKISHIDVYTHKMPESIKLVSLSGGSGSSFWRSALRNNADVYITADMKYHELTEAVREGMTVANINHGEMERASLPELAKRVSESGIETLILNAEALREPLRI